MLLGCAVWGAVCGAGDGAGGRVLGGVQLGAKGHEVWGAGAGAVLGLCCLCWCSLLDDYLYSHFLREKMRELVHQGIFF